MRVEIRAAGVCHSDLSMVNGTIVPEFPLVLGHEASGLVAAVGSEVSDLSVGMPVVLNWAAPCRTCWFCLHSQPWLCRRVEGVVSRPSGTLADGTPLHVSLGVGAFAEEAIVHRDGVVPLPDGIGLDVGAVMGCAVLTGAGAVRNTASVRTGDHVLVVGLGGIGLSAVAAASVAGADRIIAVDVSATKEEVARAMGATDFLLYDETLARSVRALTERRGVDHAFECVGKPATIRAAWSSTRRGGQCTVVGVGRTTDEVTFSAMELYHYARTLTSSVFGSSDPERDVPVLASLVRAGRLDLSPLITHREGLADLGAAFERMKQGDGVRTIIEIG
ncbi:zinc-binding dehydrogenase [Nocardioides sp.]|uniref:zinc-binding dehydrogenase n=1 Tax=Nocardioides sp. TaxID=35761 RepID=UPI003D1236B1